MSVVIPVDPSEKLFEQMLLGKVVEQRLGSGNPEPSPVNYGDRSRFGRFNFIGQELTEIPDVVWENADSVTVLNLSGNRLTELPDRINELVNLERLIVIGNQLHTLPDSLIGLKKLCYLDLSNNQLSELPKGFRDLGIKHLSLSGNMIEQINYSLVGMLEFANHVDLSNNQIRTVGNVFDSLEFIDTLNLSGNLLKELSVKFGENQRKLRTLDLSENLFAIFPVQPIINLLTTLHKLDMSFNQLSEVDFPVGIRHSTITTLDLSNNQIVELPASIGGLNNLQNLRIRNNFLTIIPATIQLLSRLGQLDLWGNPILRLPDLTGLNRLSWLSVEASAKSTFYAMGDIDVRGYMKTRKVVGLLATLCARTDM